MALRPIFKVCERYMGYKGGGGVWFLWFWQTVADAQLRDKLKDISVDAQDRRQRGSVRRGRRVDHQVSATAIGGRRRFSGIRYGWFSGDPRPLWRDNLVLVFWDVDRGHPGGKMISCEGATGGVSGQGRKRTLPWKGF